MAVKKQQKEKDLQELTEKLKAAKSVVFSDYRGTKVKDLDTFRKNLRKESIFSKVYKMTLVRKAMEACGFDVSTIDHKVPAILAISHEDEVAPARVIKSFGKEIKTISMLEGIVDGKKFSKAEMEALGDLPSKDQLRAQLLSVFNGPIGGLARVLDGYAKKKAEASPMAA